MTNREKAFQALGEYLYKAYRTHAGDLGIIILAESLDEAQSKALTYYGYKEEDRELVYRGVPLITVYKLSSTKDPQIYND